MPSRFFAPILFLSVFAVPCAVAQGTESGVHSFLEQRDRDIKRAVAKLDGGAGSEEDRRRAEALVNDRIDFREMGRLALGRYWSDLTDSQKAEFTDVFGAIVRGQSLSDLTVYNAAVTFESVVVTGERAHVVTRAAIDRQAVEVEYLLRLVRGEWWLYDIVLDDVGTVEGYSISFQSYIRKRGFDRFMANLRKKRAGLEAKRQLGE